MQTQPQIELVTVPEAAEYLEIRRESVYRLMDLGKFSWKDRQQIDGKRGRLILVASMPPDAQRRWYEARLAKIAAKRPNSEGAAPGQLDLLPSPELATLSREQLQCFLKWDHPVNEVLHHNPRDGISMAEARAKIAEKYRVSLRQLRRRVTAARKRPGDPMALVDQRRGPKKGSSRATDALKAHLRECYVIKGLSLAQSRKSAEHSGYKVTRGTAERIIKNLPPSDHALREGPDALRLVLPIVDRVFDCYAGDVWCADEWSCDGVFVHDEAQSTLLWRPYIISVIDQRSTKLLDWVLCPRPNVGYVLILLERCIRKFGRPLEFVSDKGGHFRTMVGGRNAAVESHERLIEQAMGALGYLGVRRVSPGAEKNPQGNRIERRLHGFFSNAAQRDFGLSWTGRNREERKRTGIDERVARHQDYSRGAAPRELLLVSELQNIVARWEVEYNSTPSDGNGLGGLSPDAVWLQTQAPPDELERRRTDPQWAFLAGGWTREVSERDLNFAFGDRQVLPIQKHGIIQWPGDKKRYHSAPLLALIDRERECVRLRHDHSRIVVLPSAKGETAISVPIYSRVGVVDKSGLDARMEERAAVKRLALAGSTAPRWLDRTPVAPRKALTFASDAAANIDAAWRAADAEPAEPAHEISSMEWFESHPKPIANEPPEIAVEDLAEKKSAPSLYTFEECTVEEDL